MLNFCGVTRVKLSPSLWESPGVFTQPGFSNLLLWISGSLFPGQYSGFTSSFAHQELADNSVVDVFIHGMHRLNDVNNKSLKKG